MSISYPSSIRPFLISGPHHHAFLKTSFLKHKQSFCRMMAYCRPQASLPNPLRIFFLPNDMLLPNSAHKLVPFLHQFLVSTTVIIDTSEHGYNAVISSWRDMQNHTHAHTSILLAGWSCCTWSSNKLHFCWWLRELIPGLRWDHKSS
jgi:hypothetical protein